MHMQRDAYWWHALDASRAAFPKNASPCNRIPSPPSFVILWQCLRDLLWLWIAMRLFDLPYDDRVVSFHTNRRISSARRPYIRMRRDTRRRVGDDFLGIMLIAFRRNTCFATPAHTARRVDATLEHAEFLSRCYRVCARFRKKNR